MTKKRYKKLLMSTGIRRNYAELLTQWGRKRNIKMTSGYKNLDAFCLQFLYNTEPIKKLITAVQPLAVCAAINTRGGDNHA